MRQRLLRNEAKAMTTTSVFWKTVRDHMRPALLIAEPTMTCVDAVNQMAAKDATAVVIVDATGRPHGILTEQDVVRRIAFRDADLTPIGDVMTQPVVTIADDDYLYHAVARMRRFHLRHMPVVNEAGTPVGMLHLDAALAVVADQRITQIDSLTQEGTVDGLREVKAAQVELAVELMADNIPAPDIQAVLTHVNRDVHVRTIKMNLTAMKAEGLGEPPVDFCFIVMGSAGRGESYVYPDQDNGFILDDYADEDHTRIDGWFIELATRIARDLDAVGFPLCKGNVMATNPVWRKTRSQWRAQLKGWSNKRNVVALRLCDIFFDFKAVFGNQAMAAELRTCVTDLARANVGLLRELHYDDADSGVGLGLFHRFITEKDDEAHLDEVNLKSSGTLPLVQATRLMALREGIAETSTLKRLTALHANALIDFDQFEALNDAFRHITFLMLRQQAEDFTADKPVSNYLHPDDLSELESDRLVDAFKSIRQFRGFVHSEFTGDLF